MNKTLDSTWKTLKKIRSKNLDFYYDGEMTCICKLQRNETEGIIEKVQTSFSLEQSLHLGYQVFSSIDDPEIVYLVILEENNCPKTIEEFNKRYKN